MGYAAKRQTTCVDAQTIAMAVEMHLVSQAVMEA
jgi:hypothetical protein